MKPLESIRKWFEVDRRFPGGLRYFTLIWPLGLFMLLFIWVYLNFASIWWPFHRPSEWPHPGQIKIPTQYGDYYMDLDDYMQSLNIMRSEIEGIPM